MQNCEMSLDENILTIKVDISKRYGKSKSGKSVTVASTCGNIAVPENPDIKIGLNIYTKE